MGWCTPCYNCGVLKFAFAVLAVAAAVAGAQAASADPGQDGGGCIPFVGCGTGSWNSGTGGGCIEHVGCVNGNLGDLSGCVNGMCGSWRP